MLYLTATVVYTDPALVEEDEEEEAGEDADAAADGRPTRLHVRVDSKVRAVEHGSARPTGQFHYTFAVPAKVRVVPRSYHEFMMYVDARRRVRRGGAE